MRKVYKTLSFEGFNAKKSNCTDIIININFVLFYRQKVHIFVGCDPVMTCVGYFHHATHLVCTDAWVFVPSTTDTSERLCNVNNVK